MKKIVAIALLLPVAVIAQIRYEKGYFKDVNGVKTECLIRNLDWHDNPASFEYRLTEGSEVNTRSLYDTSEFEIEGATHYVKATVGMERSSDNMQNLAVSADYQLKPETHFFKVLVDGDPSLYEYMEGGLLKFFYKSPSGEIEQLIFIKYVPHGSGGNIRKFNKFHSQLIEIAKCGDNSPASLEKVEYVRSSLMRYFEKQHDCSGDTSTRVAKARKPKFLLRPVLGVQRLHLETLEIGTNRHSTDFDKIAPAIGVEAEFMLPSYKYKWSIFVSLNYNYLNDSKDLPDGGSVRDIKQEVKFSSVQAPLGIRYYMYMTDDVKFFVNGMVALNNYVGTNYIAYNGNDDVFELGGSSFNFGFGAGVSLGKLNAEVRFYTPQALDGTFSGDVSKVSLTAAYSLF